MTTPSSAASNAALASDVAGKLRPGTYDAVQALSLLSIAQSLVAITKAVEGLEQKRG